MSLPKVRVQVAFDSTPDAATDIWTDVSQWVDLAAGVRFGRGRQDERARTTGHTCALTLDNADGRFTAARDASPYFPNVKIGRKLRVSVRVGSAAGNLLSPEDASFEGGTTGTWLDNWFFAPAPVTLTNSVSHPSHGSKGLRITWPTAAAGCAAGVFVTGLVKGRRYTAQCRVWNTAGNPPVQFGDPFGQTAIDVSTTTGTLETLSFSWTAVGEAIFLALKSNGATTAGTWTWIDSVMVDEGETVAPFTTAAPPISNRFTGYVLGWPTTFPGGDVSDVLITAGDRIAYLDALSNMRPAPSEAILHAAPKAYYPLTDESKAETAEEISGEGQPGLQVAVYGAGVGTVEFGAGTGPATDDAPAVVLTPTSTTNGRYLSSALTKVIGFFGATLLACVNTSAATTQTILRLADGGGWRIHLGTDATGKLTAHTAEPWGGTHWTLTSPSSIANGGTRVVALTLEISGGSITPRLWVDGVVVASTAIPGTWIPVGGFVHVGGNPDSGELLTGTLSHVALWSTSVVDVAAISSAILTGLGGQTINASLQQVATWAGVSTADLVMETGLLTETSHRPTEGQSPAAVLLDLANDEGGLLYVDGSGRYRFQARDHRWERSPALELDSRHLRSSDFGVDFDTQGLANDALVSRPSGGGAARVVNAESVTELGRLEARQDVAAAQDGDLVARAGWEANSRAYPYPRVGALPIDLLTMDETLTLAAAALDVGDTLTLVTLPAQATAQAFDLTIEGWAEVLSLAEWTVTANTSRSTGIPSSALAVSGQRLLRLDDLTTGLDMGFITGY